MSVLDKFTVIDLIKTRSASVATIAGSILKFNNQTATELHYAPYIQVLINPKDTKTIEAINAAVDTAIKEGAAKFGSKIPNKAALKLPLRDGDVERDDEAYLPYQGFKVLPVFADPGAAPLQHHGRSPGA